MLCSSKLPTIRMDGYRWMDDRLIQGWTEATFSCVLTALWSCIKLPRHDHAVVTAACTAVIGQNTSRY